MSNPRPHNRRILQFSLRTVFVLLTAGCIWLGFRSEKAVTQRTTLRLVKTLGGRAMYDYEYGDDYLITPKRPDPAPEPKLLRTLLGDDYSSELVFIEVRNVADSDIDIIAKQVTLRHLSVTGGLTDNALESISRLSRLETLKITGGRFSGTGLDQLSKLTKLRVLSLHNIALSNEKARSIGRLTQLEALSLHGCRIRSKQMEHLKSLRNLRMLDLTNTLVSDDGLKMLYDLRALFMVDVGGSRASPSGVRKLQGALPDALVDNLHHLNGTF